MGARIKKIIHKIFDLAIIIKAVFGFFEVLAGILLAISGQLVMNNFIISLAQNEISDDPDDVVANYLIKTANNLAQDARIFAIAYLFFHGAINIFLAISLAKGKVKAYPAIMGLLLVFIVYQAYRFLTGHSLAVLFLTLFDTAFISLIFLEYKRKRNKNDL